MTVLIAYVPRIEGQTALDKGIEMAKLLNEDVLVVNASAASGESDSIATETELKAIEGHLAAAGIKGEVVQFARGKTPLEEIDVLVGCCRVSLL